MRWELRVFTRAESGAEHVGLDHLPHVSAFIADWIAGTFAEQPAPGRGGILDRRG